MLLFGLLTTKNKLREFKVVFLLAILYVTYINECNSIFTLKFLKFIKSALDVV